MFRHKNVSSLKKKIIEDKTAVYDVTKERKSNEFVQLKNSLAICKKESNEQVLKSKKCILSSKQTIFEETQIHKDVKRKCSVIFKSKLRE